MQLTYMEQARLMHSVPTPPKGFRRRTTPVSQEDISALVNEWSETLEWLQTR